MIDWNPVRITPPAGWLLTYRKGESRVSMACYLGDGEWSDAEGRTTVTHSTFAPPTHWAYLPEPPFEVAPLPFDVTREPGPEPEIARLRARLAAAERDAARYRWLRVGVFARPEKLGGGRTIWKFPMLTTYDPAGGDHRKLDAAIDDARGAQPDEEGDE